MIKLSMYLAYCMYTYACTCKHVIFTGIILSLQVRTNYRTAVTIPERMWVDMRNTLNEYIEHRDLQRKAFNDLKNEKEKENAEKADGDVIDRALEAEGTNENEEDQHEGDAKTDTKAEVNVEPVGEK